MLVKACSHAVYLVKLKDLGNDRENTQHEQGRSLKRRSNESQDSKENISARAEIAEGVVKVDRDWYMQAIGDCRDCLPMSSVNMSSDLLSS